MTSISHCCSTHLLGLVLVWQLRASAVYHKVCKASVLEDFTVSVLLTVERSDCFDPTSQLSAYTLETDVRGTFKFGHVTMVSRYAANLFFTITNLG